ncbi:MAG TPA: LysM peptidoglycan-binding domain-containing protein, partial [Trueperaceae bacterium]|nr:LysM peptidoglycan-binding domain-containing protein [Trueperaceae bacterium]
MPGEETAQAEATEPVTVIVQAGDTLYDIAVAYDISVADLIAFNDLGGTVIHPGQELQLHAGSQPPAPLVITIQQGDSLWAIAQAYNVSLEALTAANGITGGTVLQPGHQVTVPGRYAADATDLGGAIPAMITVQPGDSLWGLARSHNTTVAAILGANDLRGDKVIVGQQLRIL